MELPYVSSPEVAFATAQVSTAVVLTALISHRPLKSRGATVLVLCGIWLSSLVMSALDWLPPMRVQFFIELEGLTLDVASVLVVLAVLLERRWSLGGGAAFAALVLHRVGTYVRGSTYERAVLHVAFAALIYALIAHAPDPTGIDTERLRNRRRRELIVFATGLLAATFVAVYVLDRFVASGDEWGYQYQADLFAHGKLYGPVPECPWVHETYWVFYWMGRAFCQYTPSWPLVVAPFQRLGIYWLASPVVFAIGLVGVGRLARRAAGEGDRAAGTASKEVRLAGILAPLLMGTSGAMLLNAGSLFSHAFVCALYAWSLEALVTITSPGLTRRGEIGWGCALGFLVALLLGARPGDAAALIPGMAVYAVYAMVRGKVRRLSVAAAALSFALVAALILVILRAQVGVWFRTGYSLTNTFRPWGAIQFSWPTRDEWKYGIPLATSAYCFWPCSMGVAAVGAVRSYGRNRVLSLILSAGLLLEFAFYAAVSGGRHYDWGYGPRYVLPTIVPLAIFGSVALAPLFTDLGRRSRLDLFRAAACAGAIVVGIATVGALLYPVAMAEIRRNGAPYRAIRAAGLKHAVVVFPPDLIAQDPADLTQNLPSVTNPDVVYLIEGTDREMKCPHRLYADREWYRAVGYDEVDLIPLD